MQSFDVVIVGGAAVGSAVACFLTADSGFAGTVLILERDPSFALASTALSAASIRHQFSTPLNVQISQFGTAFLRHFGVEMAVEGERPDLAFHEAGYLFLAASEAQAAALREAHEVQRTMGADVVLWDPDEVAAAFPHLNTADIRLASYGRSGAGWFDNVGLMTGMRRKARAQGAAWQVGEVVAVDRAGARVSGVTLSDGTRIGCGVLVNAAGPRAAALAAMAGLNLPVEPRKRTVFVFDAAHSPEGSATVNGGRLPLTIDPTGVWCRPEGRHFLAGGVPVPDDAMAFDDFEPCHCEFEDRVWPALAARSPAFEALKVVNLWAGHYAYNTLDQNAVIGPHDEVDNFLFANGFSGHGLQQAPAVGRGLAEWIVHGGWRTLDLSPLGYGRIRRGEPIPERAII